MIIENKKNMINMLSKMSIVSVTLVALFLFACKNEQKSVSGNKIDKIYFGNVDENPLFDGKPVEKGFREYVSRSICWPAKAYGENFISGRIFVEFIVERDGSVSNAKVVGGADPLFEFEALRVINSSPNWAPGKLNGEAIRMSYTLPINFMGNTDNNLISTSKKAKLSKKTILLEEIVILVFG